MDGKRRIGGDNEKGSTKKQKTAEEDEVKTGEWKEKFLADWTREDTQNWITHNPDYEPLRPVLQNFSGEDLMSLTKEELREQIRYQISMGFVKGEHASLEVGFFNSLRKLKVGLKCVSTEQFLHSYTWNTSNHKKYVTDTEEMPLQLRQDTFKAIERNIHNRREVWSSATENRLEHPFLVAAGAPGVGKSRVLQELDTRLDTGSKVHTIILTFGNGRAPKRFDKDLDINLAIGIRLLHRLGPEDQPLDDFYSDCEKSTDINEFRARSILKEYLDRLNPKKEAMDVILAIDEFQSLLMAEDGKFASRTVEVNGEEIPRKISNSLRLLDDLVQLYGGFLLTQPFYKSHNVFLTVVFSGTYLQPLRTVFRESGNIPYEQLLFPLLKTSDLQRVVLETRRFFQPGCDPSSNRDFWKQLFSFGGWPRPTSEFLARVRKENRLANIHWQTLTNEVLEWLSKSYTNWQDELPYEVLRQLLIKSLLRKKLELPSATVIPSSSKQLLVEQFGETKATFWMSVTWEGLARLGLCALEPILVQSSSSSSSSSTPLGQFHLVLPPAVAIWFLTKQERFREDNKHWNRVLDQLQKQIEFWQQWEVFCCWHEIIRGFLMYLDLIPEAGSSEPLLVRLNDFFPTPLHHKTLDDIFIDITNSPNTNYAHANQRWPQKDPWTDSGRIDISNRAHVVLNAEGAVCDWFSQGTIRPIKVEGKDITKINLCGQAKHTKKGGSKKTKSLSLASIQKEREKIDKTFVAGDTLNVLCIITNRPVSNDVVADALPKYTLVIHPEVHDAYFGGFHPGALDKIVNGWSSTATSVLVQ